MACILWPVNLPNPEIPFGGNLDLPLLGGKTNDLGAYETKRVRTDAVISGSCSLLLAPDEVVIFTNFYRDDLNDGMYPFDAMWLFELGYNGYKAKIVKAKYSAKGAATVVKLDLILEPATYTQLVGDEWYLEEEAENDFDEPEVNPCICPEDTGDYFYQGADGIDKANSSGNSYSFISVGWPVGSLRKAGSLYLLNGGYLEGPIEQPSFFDGAVMGWTNSGSICPILSSTQTGPATSIAATLVA